MSIETAIAASQAFTSADAVDAERRPVSWPRVLSIWLGLAVAMSFNGIVRETVLVPAVKRRGADVLSALSGIAIILSVTRAFLRGRRASEGVSPGRVAATWGVLTVAFELLFGHFGDHKSWSELLGNWAIWRGRLWPVVFASILASPFLWLRRSQGGETSSTIKDAAPAND